MLLGAVDLGSNSFRVEIGRVENDQIVTQSYWKETVRLAAGFDKDGNLTPEIQERALNALRRFHEKLEGLPTEKVKAVGTQSLRVANNSPEFLKKAEDALGYPIDILSGHEEARLVFKGCSHTLPPTNKRRLVVDIGGASTEFVIGRNYDAEKYESFHTGCVETSIRFFSDGKLTEKSFDHAVLACCAEFCEGRTDFGAGQYDEAYGSAGTFSAVSNICVALGWSDGEVTMEHLIKLRKELLSYQTIEKIKLPGMKPDRKEVIAGGIAILIAVFKTLGIRVMLPATGALRVGLLYELLQRVEHRDTRDMTVEHMIMSTGVDKDQAHLVADFSEQILLNMDPDASLEDVSRLKWASLLHEIGMLISTSRHHRHGQYIIAHADMPGFTRSEKLHIATMILGQRGGLAKIEDFLDDVFNENLMLSLRLGILFAHSRREIPLPSLAVIKGLKETTLALPKVWLEEHPLSQYLLEQECLAWGKINKPLTVKAI